MIPLVLVHGFLGGSAQWQAQIEGFGDTQDIVTVDLPGFGQNNHLPVINTIRGFAEWTIAELRRRGVHNYHLLGHSMGGMIAQEIVRRDQDQVASLVLYGTGAVGILPGRFETIEESKARANLDGAIKTARRIAATWFLEREAAAGYEACASLAEQTTAEAISAGLDAMLSWSGVNFLSNIKPETLVIWGDRDRTYSWDQPRLLWETIPNAGLAVVPGCAHAVHAEKPELFNALIADFLAD